MNRFWYRITLISSVLFTSFSTVHLIDDFLNDIPAEFNLGVPFTELLTFLFIVSIIGLIIGAAKKSQISFLGLSIAGLLITAAQLTKSFPEILQPGPWRSGFSSVLIVIGLSISSTVLMISAYLSWRLSKNNEVSNTKASQSLT